MLDEVHPETQKDAQIAPAASSEKRLGHFRQILLWPVQLVPANTDQDHAANLANLGPHSPWREIEDEFTGDPLGFQERHYSEFVTFLPPVQRFLYGSGRSKIAGSVCADSPIKAFRRSDIGMLRAELTPGAKPLELSIAHIDLYFFFEIDIAILALELSAADVPLAVAQEAMFRLGRAYPAYWEPSGSAGHCPHKVEFVAHDGRTLATSDYDNREKFLTQVCAKRSPRVAAHWQFLLQPLVAHHSDSPGTLRYKQLEYYRMPQLAFLAMNPGVDLTRADYVRLAFASGPGDCDELPFSQQHLEGFEEKFCYDRYFGRHNGVEWPESRYMSCGHALVVTGDASNAFFVDVNNGCLNSFRHEHFLLFLIAHFHKAALLMFSDRLTEAMSQLDTSDQKAVQSFRAASRRTLQIFLRFTHRYWFHAVSNQTQAHDLFALCRAHLDIDRLYEDIRQELREMSEFMENEALRRQADTVTRLTVVTTLGLIGTTVTGFLGMNIIAWAEQSATWRVTSFMVVLVPTIVLTLITIAKSRRLADFMESLADETVGWGKKFLALAKTFGK